MTTRTHSGPPAALFAALLVAACGGGGGGGAAGDGDTDPPTTPASRTVSFSYDYDNNGVADATATASYDAAGRDTGLVYTYTGDGTPDRHQPMAPNNEVYERSYDSAGNLVRMVFRPAGGTVTTMDTSFDAAGLPLRTDFSFVPNPTGSFGQIVYIQAGGRLTGATTTLNGTVIAEERLEFGADGYPSQRETTKPVQVGNPEVARTEYLWNADGKLERARVDDDGDGSFETTLTMTYAAGLHVSTVKTVAGGIGNLTVTSFRDGLGRIVRTEHDLGSDGSIDAVITATWENGPCVVVRMPGLPPFVGDSLGGFASTADGKVDTGCGPVQP